MKYETAERGAPFCCHNVRFVELPQLSKSTPNVLLKLLEKALPQRNVLFVCSPVAGSVAFIDSTHPYWLASTKNPTSVMLHLMQVKLELPITIG